MLPCILGTRLGQQLVNGFMISSIAWVSICKVLGQRDKDPVSALGVLH